MLSIAHIVNPVRTSISSDLHVAQPITFESMRLAQAYAKQRVEVSLFSAQFAEDRDIVPSWLRTTTDIDRSVLDVGSFANGKRLPLISDILDRLSEASTAEYFIYSNVDIALMPYFYTAVADLIDTGYDAFVINRRTISANFNRVNQLALMFAEVGTSHPGHDCFVFRREVYPKYILGSACIGADGIGRLLLCNLTCQAQRFTELSESHLTFHIGDERNWRQSEHSPYNKHNQCEILTALEKMDAVYGPFEQDSATYRYIHGYRQFIKEGGHAGQSSLISSKHVTTPRWRRIQRYVANLVRRRKNSHDH